MQRSLAPAVLLLLLPAACTSPSPTRAVEVESTVDVEVVPLKHTAAAEIEELVLELVGAARRVERLQKEGRTFPGLRRVPHFGPEFCLVADPGTNSIVLHGAGKELEGLRELIARLDVKG